MNIKLFTFLSLAAFSMILTLKKGLGGVVTPNRNPSACKGTGQLCNDSD
jgi:hypothetical protein